MVRRPDTTTWPTSPRKSDNDGLSFANVPDAVHVARLISTLQAHHSQD
jgi:hypothetical protein